LFATGLAVSGGQVVGKRMSPQDRRSCRPKTPERPEIAARSHHTPSEQLVQSGKTHWNAIALELNFACLPTFNDSVFRLNEIYLKLPSKTAIFYF